MRFSRAFSLTILMALGANAQDILDLVPRGWLAERDPLSAIHLGDDGVLRRMVTDVPIIARRDDYLREARWEVKDAIAFAPHDIRRWLNELAPSYSERDNRHFEEVYAGVDGRDVHPDALMDPHPSLRLRSLGSIEEVRDIQRRSNDADKYSSSLSRRTGCRGSGDCTAPFRCVILDMRREGTCVR